MLGALQNRVDELDRTLLREHARDAEFFDKLGVLQQQTGILHGTRPLCRFLRPYFLSESKYTAIQRAAKSLYGAFAAVTESALADDAIAADLGLTDKELRWARLDPGYGDVSVTSRLDTFLTKDGFAFLEYNGENPAGIGDQTALETLFQLIPAVRRFLGETPHHFPQPHERLLDAMRRAYRSFGGRKERPNIAIVDWTGVDTAPEFEILRLFFEAKGFAVKVCDPLELEYGPRGLVAGDFEVDIFYKRVIIHEFLERFDEEHAVFQACANGAVCMVNSWRSKVPHKKSTFSILTDDKYAGLFNEEQRAAIGAHVPWTRNVRNAATKYGDMHVELLEFIRNERQRFVLKPNDDYGGRGIKFGWESSESEWDDAIQAALDGTYVVQERVAVERTQMPAFSDGEARMETLTVDFDPFLFCGEVEGGMVRLAPGSLVNITQGGGETALAILKGC